MIRRMERLREICHEKGVFLRREALEAGYDDRTLAGMRRAGEVHRVSHGAYTFADLWAGADQRRRHGMLARAVYRSAKTEVALSHVSGVLEYTTAHWGLDLARAHLTHLNGRSGRRGRAARHHRGEVLPGDVVAVNGVNCIAPPRACLELTTVASVESSLVSINAILNAGTCTLAEIAARYERSMEHWPSTLRTNLVLRLADPRISSVGESRLFHLLWQYGFPMPVPQYEVRDERGRVVAIVDFAWPALGIFIEFDGKTKYTKLLEPGQDPGDVVFAEKRREDLIRRLTGWTCIRLVWADLEQKERSVALLRPVFAAAVAA